MTYHTEAQVLSRSETLREATHSTHERLDRAIMAARPFASVGNYGRFLKVQHAFHRDVSPLYLAPVMQHHIPDLHRRARLNAVTQDATDLGIDLPDYGEKPAAGEGVGPPEALGWLYVVEGSNLGGAFLCKAALKMGLSAEHGARHLSEGPEGRAAGWRSFKEALNGIRLSPSEEARVILGAETAFARVRNLVAQHLGGTEPAPAD